MEITDKDRLDFIQENLLSIVASYVTPYNAHGQMIMGDNTFLVYNSENEVISRKRPYITVRQAIDNAIMAMREWNKWI